MVLLYLLCLFFFSCLVCQLDRKKTTTTKKTGPSLRPRRGSSLFKRCMPPSCHALLPIVQSGVLQFGHKFHCSNDSIIAHFTVPSPFTLGDTKPDWTASSGKQCWTLTPAEAVAPPTAGDLRRSRLMTCFRTWVVLNARRHWSGSNWGVVVWLGCVRAESSWRSMWSHWQRLCVKRTISEYSGADYKLL